MRRLTDVLEDVDRESIKQGKERVLECSSSLENQLLTSFLAAFEERDLEKMKVSSYYGFFVYSECALLQRTFQWKQPHNHSTSITEAMIELLSIAHFELSSSVVDVIFRHETGSSRKPLRVQWW